MLYWEWCLKHINQTLFLHIFSYKILSIQPTCQANDNDIHGKYEKIWEEAWGGA